MSDLKYVRDDVTLRQLWVNPIFLTQVGLTALLTTTTIVATVWQYWPPYCSYDSFIFYINLGTASSFTIVEIASILTWIIFESNNWVYYVLVYLIHGTVLLVGSVIFFIDYSVNCYGSYAWPCNDVLLRHKHVVEDCEIYAEEAVTEGFFLFTATGYLILAIAILLMREKFSL